MSQYLSPKQLARAVGTSESSIRRWCDAGKLNMERTSGGHRRIPRAEALRFIRRTQMSIVRPEILVATGGRQGLRPDTLITALEQGDATLLTAALDTLYVHGMSTAAICDGPLFQALSHLGALWPEDDRSIMIEHRATMLAIRGLAHLRSHFARVDDRAPVAMGGAPGQDPYLLPSWMAATVLAELGFNDINLGPDTPIDVLSQAAEDAKAEIVWLSLSTRAPARALRNDVHALARRVHQRQGYVFIGGRRARTYDLEDLPGLHVFDSMVAMAGFAEGYWAARNSRKNSA